MRTTAKYQTFFKRLFAGIIDALVFLPFVFLENDIYDTQSNSTFIGWMVFEVICWSLYSIIGHGRNGQTVGKWVMKIKVLDLNEQNVIGYTRAFYRDSVWILTYIVFIAYFLVSANNNIEHDKELRITLFSNYMSIVSLGWFLLELITMLFNDKRRAIHDFMAGSVVVDLPVLERERLEKERVQNERGDLLAEFQ